MNIPFYGFKIINKDKLIADYKPCIDSDGVAGVYDFVSGKFLKLDNVESYAAINNTTAECNCWRCVAERSFNAKRVSKMQVGKVYLYQMYSESFEEFDAFEEAEQFRDYANKNIPYWNYDPVSTIDLNDYEQVIIYKHRGWIK